MDDIAPLSRARALDPKHYLGPDALAFDQANILAPGWQVLAPESAASGTGDHIVREIAGRPVIIVRGADGVLRGFFNICRHRAGPLAACDGRGAKRLRCGYHGWAYGLDGGLKAAPGMDGAEDFDPSKLALAPIDVEVWGGLVFARARTATSPQGVAFSDWIGGLETWCDAAQLAQMRHHHARVYEVGSNWKVYADNYLEGYHLPWVHPKLTQVVDFPGYTTELGRYWSAQLSEVETETAAYATGKAVYVFLHPNTMLNIMPGRMQTNRILPDGPDRCRIEFDFYYSPGEEHRAGEDDAFSDEVQEEDRRICEHVQKALASGAYEAGRLAPAHEAGLWAWHGLLREAYAAKD
jgi:choline monooxygenase